MPKFLWTVIVLTASILAALILTISKTSPENTKNIAFFLIELFLFLTLLFSFIFYIVNYKRAPKYSDLRNIYRASIKPSLFLSTFITGTAVMKVAKALTPLNFILFTIFLICMFKLTSVKRT